MRDKIPFHYSYLYLFVEIEFCNKLTETYIKFITSNCNSIWIIFNHFY